MVELHENTHSTPSCFGTAPLASNSDLQPHLSNGTSSHCKADDITMPFSFKSHFSNGDLHKLSPIKAHPSNGDLSRPSPIKAHSSNREFSKLKAYNSHGDLNRPPFFIKLPRLWLLTKRRFFIFCSVLFLLLLAFMVFPNARVYPTLKHPFLVDLGEHAERAQITKILDGTWDRVSAGAQARYSYLHDKYRHEDHYSERYLERRRVVRARDQRLPIQLSSPRYTPFWPQFRGSLRTWVQNKHYDPYVMKELLSMVKDPIDKHYMSKPNHTVKVGKPYKTCAVVGNSGILLNQSHASFIDSHEMVMRLNNARITGFEQYVGSKTTLSFVNSNILHTCSRRTGCFCHPYGADVPLIMYICQVVHLMDVALCGSMQKAPIIVTDARFDTLCARIVKYYSLKKFVETLGRRLEDWSDAHEGPLFHYSSGMQAVLLAVGICEKVSILGFGKSETSKHHYHTSQRSELRLHDYSAEYEFYSDLATRDARLIPFLNEAGFSLPSVDIYWQ